MSEKQFKKWWSDEGSGMVPFAGCDMEEHAHRIAEVAWLTGETCADLRTRSAILNMKAGVEELTEQILLRDEAIGDYEVSYLTWRTPALFICAFVGLAFLLSRFL